MPSFTIKSLESEIIRRHPLLKSMLRFLSWDNGEFKDPGPGDVDLREFKARLCIDIKVPGDLFSMGVKWKPLIIRLPHKDHYTEAQYFDLIIYQFEYKVLKERYAFSNKKEATIWAKISSLFSGIVINDPQEFPLKILLTAGSTSLSVRDGVLVVPLPQNRFYLHEINILEQTPETIALNLSLVELYQGKTNSQSIDVFIKIHPEGEFEMSEKRGANPPAWLTTIYTEADFYENPINIGTRKTYIKMPGELYSGAYIYTNKIDCTFVKLDSGWISVNWRWLSAYKEQFPKEIREELDLILSIEKTATI